MLEFRTIYTGLSKFNEAVAWDSESIQNWTTAGTANARFWIKISLDIRNLPIFSMMMDIKCVF